VSGRLSGEFHLTGSYERPVGFGAMTIDTGVAYGERFQEATSALRFDGTGVRLDSLNLSKDGGAVTGAAYIGWDATYSFNAAGRRIPVEKLAFVTFPQAPLSGSPSSPRPAAARSRRRATTSGIGSTICSSARKASAPSTGRWRCAAPSSADRSTPRRRAWR
jgi:hypothetical protein